MPTPSSPPAPGPAVFAHRSQTPAQAVAQQFATRPTLHQVVGQMLQRSIQEQYPSLAIDLDVTRLAIPNRLGGWDLKRLLDVALDHLANGTPLDFSPSANGLRYFLSNYRARHLTYEAQGPREPDMGIIENTVRELASTLVTGFQDALSDYWNQAGDTGANRWQWLGDLLASGLSSAASLLPPQYRAQQTALHLLVRHPDRREREDLTQPQGRVHAYCLETRIVQGSRTVNLIEPDLVVMQGQQVMVYRVSGDLECYPSIEAFNQAWGQAKAGQVAADNIVIKRSEPDGNIFDTQAALLLNRQLEALGAIELPSNLGVSALETLFATTTELAPFFLDAPAPDPTALTQLRPQVPAWLQNAAPADRFAYRQCLVDLAAAQRQSAGKSFLDGIENLHDFTRQALREQMHSDHPDAPPLEPDDLELTFHVPTGTLGSGYLTRVSMTLSELAIRNLEAAPQGSLTVRSRSGAAVPDWLNAEYVLGSKGLFGGTPGLISRLNIGARYPQTLKAQMLGDNEESRAREVLFDLELRARLPLQALEHKIRGEHGLTFQGYRYVQAVMHRSAADRRVDEQDIVMRPLAFIRQPHSRPDVVSNMFIIEAADTGVGPHILYRPLYQDALREFPSRAALFRAITLPSPLQTSVLEWLPERARAVYANNGFISPHVIRFGQGDDTVQWPPPEPAQLAQAFNGHEVVGSMAQALEAGNLSQYLYGSNARTLVDLADRDSVSNTESRWEILLEGGWLMFNAVLLPLLRGPAMVVGWVAQLAVSLQHDLPALHSDDAATRELAWVDVLLNIGLILLHVVSRQAIPIAQPSVRPSRPATSPAIRIEQGPIGLPAEPPANDATRVDFIHSTARDSSNRRLLDTLLDLHVFWHDPPPLPVELGPYKGLYRINNQWHASVAALLFRVKVVEALDEVFIIHPQKPSHPGFKLKTDGQGHWTLDRGLKLRGGGPKERHKAKLLEIEQKRVQAWADANEANDKIAEQAAKASFLYRILDASKAAFEKADLELKSTDTKRRATPADPALVKDHADKAQLRARTRLNLQVIYERYAPVADQLQQQRRELIERYKQMRASDARFAYEDNCLKQYQQILAGDELRISFVGQLHLASFVSDQGESVLELMSAERDVPANQRLFDLLETSFATSEAHRDAVIALETTLEAMTDNLKVGPAERQKFLNSPSEPQRRFYNRFCVAVEQLEILTVLGIDESIEPTTPHDAYFFSQMEHLHYPEVPVDSSYVDLLSTQGFTNTERKAVLTNVIDHYNRRLEAYRTLVDLDSQLINPRYMPLLIDRVVILRDSAEADLANLLREDELLPVQVIRFKPSQAPSSTKRVFRTRDKGALVGDLQPADAQMPFPTMVIKKTGTGQVNARFMEHPNEGWVEIVDARPVPPARPPVRRSLASLRTESQRLLQQIEPLENSIEFQKRKLSDPKRRDELNPRDWRDMLDYQARRIDAIADEMHTQHQGPADVAATVERLRQKATQLRHNAEQHCIEGYKAQRPRQENIDYLSTHAAIDIGLVHGPRRTAAMDYVSEFAVREKNSLTVLWYAHFHYDRANSSPAEYSVAHLKRPEHRFITLKDLIAQAGTDSKVIVRDLYNPITAPLDQRLFLNLLPD